MVKLHIFSCIFYFLLNHKTFTAVLYLLVTEHCISGLFYAIVSLTPLQEYLVSRAVLSLSISLLVVFMTSSLNTMAIHNKSKRIKTHDSESQGQDK